MALITPYLDIQGATCENKPQNKLNFISYINNLEGYKTRIKSLHWQAEAMNIHNRLDEFLEVVSEYQDSIAEEYMGIHEPLAATAIYGSMINIFNPIELMINIKECTCCFYKDLGDCIEYAGLRSETENFIHNINKYIYLFKLCKG